MSARGVTTQLGVRATLFVVFVLLASIPVGVLGYVYAQTVSRVTLEDLDERHVALATSLARELAQEVQGRIHVVSAVSASIAEVGLDDIDAVGRLLRGYRDRHPESSIYVANDQAVSILGLDINGERHGVDYTSRRYAQRVLADGTPQLDGPRMGLTSGVPQVAIASPVAREGQVVGYVAVSMPLDFIGSMIRQTGEQLDNGRIVVTNADGLVIGDTNAGEFGSRQPNESPLLLADSPRPFYAVDELGVQHRAARSVLPIGWRVTVARANTYVDARVDQSLRQVLGAAAIAALFAILAALIFAQRISAPLRRLADYAEQVSTTESVSNVGVLPTRELNSLGDAVERMVGRLKDHADSLEQTVEERTAQLRASISAHERLAAAVSQAKESVAIFDSDNRCIYANSATESLTGYELSSMLDQPPMDHSRRKRDEDEGENGYLFTLLSAAHAGDSWSGTFWSRHAAGDWVEFEGSVTPVITDEGDSFAVAIRRDITERRQVEETLRFNDRLVTIGTAAAGLAHELVDPLSYLRSNVEWVMDEMRKSAQRNPEELEPWVEALADSLQVSDRIRRLSEDLRAFARDEPAEPEESADVTRALELALRLVDSRIKNQGKVVRDFAELPPVAGSTERLSQAFVNLLNNAAQAMAEKRGPGKNSVTVRTRAVDNWVEVSIRDTGVGIPSEKLREIFNPFYSTKPSNLGSGLGLPISHRIITRAGGDISVESSLGYGTTVYVRLPVQHPVPRARVVEPLALQEHRTRILVVDEEALLGDRLRSAVPDARVDAVGSYAQALDRLERCDFDAIVCDLMMPDLTGAQIFRQVRSERPEMAKRFIFVCGGSLDGESREFLSEAGAQLLHKPFGEDELDAALNAVLRPGADSPNAAAS
ncbi:MAG: ATP-binding protein [Myxococcota bacterium]